jgi:hypothetical protein
MINIRFKIDDNLHTSPTSWDAVPFSRYLQYFDQVAPHEPQQLKDFIQGHHEAIAALDEGLTQEQREAEALRLFNEAWAAIEWRDRLTSYYFMALDVGFWCEGDAETILNDLEPTDLEAAYWALQVQMNPDNAKVSEEYTGFSIDGIEYLLPKKHMIGSTVEEYADASYFQESMDSYKGGNWGAMLDVMTVLCRPKDETYNDNEAFRNKRKELFKDLPMSDVINVAFFLLRLSETLRTSLAIYTAQQEVQALQPKSLITATGGEMLSSK